jgi:hypothetical protein
VEPAWFPFRTTSVPETGTASAISGSVMSTRSSVVGWVTTAELPRATEIVWR